MNITIIIITISLESSSPSSSCSASLQAQTKCFDLQVQFGSKLNLRRMYVVSQVSLRYPANSHGCGISGICRSGVVPVEAKACVFFFSFNFLSCLRVFSRMANLTMYLSHTDRVLWPFHHNLLGQEAMIHQRSANSKILRLQDLKDPNTKRFRQTVSSTSGRNWDLISDIV